MILAPLRVSNKVQIQDPNVPDQLALVDENGRIAVVQHAHPDTGAIHFHIDGLTVGTYRFILIDISDITNYPHANTTYAHVEWVEIQVDSNNTGAYSVSLGFLENVNGDNGDRYIIKHWSGSKTVGNQLLIFEHMVPAGWRMQSGRILTHAISVNDANYQTDVNLPSSIDPSAPDTPSGDGDVITEIIVTAGEINIAIDIGYHSH